MMPTLFTYRITHDTGFAPNPFGGICTLVTCKPKIRLAAEPGDWVAAIGASNPEIGTHRNRLIYAMRVSDKLTLQQYDELSKRVHKVKIADSTSSDPIKRVGDSIFDFTHNPPLPRPSMHSSSRKTLDKDLRGEYALISDHFYYFGDGSIELPAGWLTLFPQAQGHRSRLNDPYLNEFVEWINSRGFEANCLHGQPIQSTKPASPLVQPPETALSIGCSKQPKKCR